VGLSVHLGIILQLRIEDQPASIRHTIRLARYARPALFYPIVEYLLSRVVLCGSVGNSQFPMLDALISGSRVGTHSARLKQIPITDASSVGFWAFFSREQIAHTLAGVYPQGNDPFGGNIQDDHAVLDDPFP
jgi:hypothetical protein